MTKRLFIITAVVALLGGATAIATAQSGDGFGPRRGGPGGPGGPMRDFGLRGIELTDAQRDQVKTIMDAHRDELQKAGTAVREAHRALAEATRADPVNEEAIRTASAAVGSAMANESILRARIRGEVSAILTAEQQETLKTRGRRRQ
jgi:periplasmic protein CpxP/Spy